MTSLEVVVSQHQTARRVWLMVALLLALTAFALAPLQQPTTMPNPANFVAQRPPEVEKPTGRLVEAYILARPATLQIEVRSREGIFRPFVQGMGTGFFISPDGYVLTAYHVIESVHRDAVLVGIGHYEQEYPLTLVGFDAFLDLALLRADVGIEVPYLPLAQTAPAIGSSVVAIGNSRGDFLQPRAGQVTRLGVTASRADFASGTIELTAALAPGDSGGPVVNARGEVVGVVSYISFMPEASFSQSDRFIPPFLRGIALPRSFASYAVPTLVDSAVVADMRLGGQRDVPVIGFSWRQDYNPRDSSLNLGSLAGPIVHQVQPGGPAYQAGLRDYSEQLSRNHDGQVLTRDVVADVIISVDGERTRGFNDLLEIVRRRQIGQTVLLEVQRGNSTAQLELTLGAKAEVFR